MSASAESFLRVGEEHVMTETEPVAPPVEPEEEPGPEREAPPAPERELDPFNPEWPRTRPTPEPKARGKR